MQAYHMLNILNLIISLLFLLEFSRILTNNDEEGFGGSHIAIYDATFSLIRALEQMCDGKSTKGSN